VNNSQTIREKLHDKLYGKNYIYDETFSKIKLENVSSCVGVCLSMDVGVGVRDVAFLSSTPTLSSIFVTT
jgi:hypothetical protein